ncbi:MAG TPA: hypothetical protein VMU87_13805 [Stellaceae bacterium]|nr:hypothetical protein [Stellaceae bacterium]
MASFALRLFTDRLAPGAALTLDGNACRILYVAEGRLTVAAGGTVAALAPDTAWHGTAASLRAGADGARVLRYELGAGDRAPASDSGLALAAPIGLERERAWLIRCDRVEFPPGGVAYTHTHQGPGIRCLQQGGIRVETAGTVRHYAPGEAWFESGPDPVFAAGSESATTAFVRVMVLPRDYLGRSSIRYVRPEDEGKPRRQSYRIYIDTPVSLPGSPA